MDETENISMWHKKPDELTMGENLTVAVVATGAILAMYAAAFGGFVAVVHIGEKLRARKQKKLEAVGYQQD